MCWERKETLICSLGARSALLGKRHVLNGSLHHNLRPSWNPPAWRGKFALHHLRHPCLIQMRHITGTFYSFEQEGCDNISDESYDSWKKKKSACQRRGSSEQQQISSGNHRLRHLSTIPPRQLDRPGRRGTGYRMGAQHLLRAASGKCLGTDRPVTLLRSLPQSVSVTLFPRSTM